MKIFIFLLFALSLFSKEIHIDNQTDLYSLTDKIDYYIANNKIQNFIDIAQKNDKFLHNNRSPLLLGYLEDRSLWLKFSLTNDSNTTVTKILNFNYPIQQDLYLYDTLSKQLLLPGKNFSFTPYYELLFAPHETKHFLMQSHNKDIGTVVDLQILKPETFNRQNRQEIIALMLFIGAIGALILYNLFLLFLTKDRSYFYYIVMITIFSILILHINGFFGIIFDGFHLSKNLLYVLLLILAISMIFFTKTFLNLEVKFPKINTLLDYVFLSLIVVFIGSILGIIPTLFQRFYYSSLFLLLIYIGFYAYKRGYKEALYYLLGWSVLFISIFTLVLRQGGISDIYDQIPHFGYMGVVSEAMLFSMALSARISTMKKEREQALNKLIQIETQKRHDLEQYAKEQNKELQKALNEKDLLLKELHHRVKNNLQIIISLLRLQADKFENRDLLQILQESENRIRAISRVHEMLYQDNSEMKIDMKRYFESLIYEITSVFPQSAKNIHFSIISSATMDINRAIYCGLIINELVTNSLKYAFLAEEKGEITITLHQNENSYILIYTDSGKGFDKESITDNSLGLKLIQILTKNQLQGTIDFHGENGSYFKITFPLN